MSTEKERTTTKLIGNCDSFFELENRNLWKMKAIQYNFFYKSDQLKRNCAIWSYSVVWWWHIRHEKQQQYESEQISHIFVVAIVIIVGKTKSVLIVACLLVLRICAIWVCALCSLHWTFQWFALHFSNKSI